MQKKLVLAYIAGLVDGEGCIRIKRTNPYHHLTGRVNCGYHEAIQIRMVDEAAIKLIAETLGGWYYKEKPHCNNGRPLYCYQATDKAAVDICKTLLPYLLIKREQAEAVLKLRTLKETQKRKGKSAFTEADIAERDALYLRCRELKTL